MQSLIVLAHPLKPSLSAHFADLIAARLRDQGHAVRLLDLYEEGFDPVLSASERTAYYADAFSDTAGLASTETLVLVFPTWWFALPAILKGWIDRSFLPGVAFDHAADLTALSPRLTTLRQVFAVTTLGSPAWLDWLILRRPVRRALKWGLVKACAPQARFRMLSLYSAENPSSARVTKFSNRILKELDHIA